MWAYSCDARGDQAELGGSGSGAFMPPTASAARRDGAAEPARGAKGWPPMPVSAPGDKRTTRDGAARASSPGAEEMTPSAGARAMGTPPPPHEGDQYASSTSPSSGEDQPPEPALALSTAGTSTGTGTGASGLSSMWLNWENPRAVMELCTESESGSALEMRRQKNRESMRRSRQRARDQLQNLRDVVAQLEKQYTALCLKSEPLDARAASDRDRHYADAVELAKRLGAENLYLKASIQSQASWKLELHRVMETTVVLDEFTASASTPPSPFPFKLEVMNEQEAASIYGFHPVLTRRDVKDLILDNAHTVKRVRKMLLGGTTRGSKDSEDPDVGDNNSDSDDFGVEPNLNQDEVRGPVARSELFGWDMRRRVRGNEMEFVFTKQFHGISVSEVMQKAWVNSMHLAGTQMAKYDVKRLDILQEVSPNAYVLGRDVRSPDEDPVFRTTLLRYRMETTGEVATDSSWLLDGEQQQSTLRASGFVIGTQSINPSSNSGAKLLPERSGIEPTARLVWAELAHTFEFLTVVDRVSGEEQYVQIRWSGKTNYGTPFDARRNAADTVSTLLRWELGTIAPAVQLIASSSDDGDKNQREEENVVTAMASTADLVQ